MSRGKKKASSKPSSNNAKVITMTEAQLNSVVANAVQTALQAVPRASATPELDFAASMQQTQLQIASMQLDFQREENAAERRTAIVMGAINRPIEFKPIVPQRAVRTSF